MLTLSFKHLLELTVQHYGSALIYFLWLCVLVFQWNHSVTNILGVFRSC